ncbi:MAG: MBOAT family protein [Oscillospiraceae bacterium]|nr:MBOAT family protein [Oscillospiraceae bacterium]
MVFSSLTFLCLFLPTLLLLYYPGRSGRWRNGVLVAFSLLFYGWGEPVLILGMLFSTAVNYLAARAICATENSTRRKLYLTIGVIASVIFLFYFKYAAFLLNSLTALLGMDYRMPVPELPIGISFYTFQILTYTVDVYRGKAPMLKNPMKLLLYISCFPQLIAGPIVQYADVADQLDERRISTGDFSAGMRRFSVGLAKKILLANICGAALEETALATGADPMSVLGAWLSIFLYTMQIYFDFSAYSDMAIGLGRLLGFTYKENFNFPYISRSITEFWRRWHISLSSFFRDYIYIPLGGNRRGDKRTAINMLIVWALTGFWHGASWNFLAWGAYYGVLLLLERFVLKAALDRLPGLIRWCLTFALVMIGWVLFYYTDFAALLRHLGAMFGLGGVTLIDAKAVAVLRKYTIYPLLAFALSLPLVPALDKRICARVGENALYNGAKALLCVGLLILSVLFLVGQTYNPFIYFRF